MITGKSESKVLTKDVSCKCNCRFTFNLIQINVGITINIYMSVKSVMYVKKIMLGILLHAVAKIENIK